MTRIDLTHDPAIIGARFHAKLAGMRCQAVHARPGEACAECHAEVAPIVKPIAQLLLRATREGVKVTYARFVRTAEKADQRASNPFCRPR